MTMDKNIRQEADDMLNQIGWPLDENIEATFNVDDEVCLVGGGGKLGRVLDVQPSMMMVKFPGEKAEWVDKRLVMHYSRGE